MADPIGMEIMRAFAAMYDSVDNAEDWNDTLIEFWAPYGGRDAVNEIAHAVKQQMLAHDNGVHYVQDGTLGYALGGCLLMGALLATRKGSNDELEALFALPAAPKELNPGPNPVGEGAWVDREGYDFVD